MKICIAVVGTNESEDLDTIVMIILPVIHQTCFNKRNYQGIFVKHSIYEFLCESARNLYKITSIQFIINVILISKPGGLNES